MSSIKKMVSLFLMANAIMLSAKELKLMTYNIYGARLTNGQKLGQSIKPYSPDFVSLQEVDRNTQRSNFRDVTSDIAKELGYGYYYFQKAMDYDKGEFGIAFISKFPIEKIYSYELPSMGRERRQLIIAEIQKKVFGEKVLIMNTHLDFKQEMKPEEIESLGVLTSFFDKNDIKFISGDFNFLPTTSYYSEMIKNWKDTYMEARSPEIRSLDKPRIDYIFGNKSNKWRVKSSYYINDNTQDWTKLSDHLPYMAVLDIR